MGSAEADREEAAAAGLGALTEQLQIRVERGLALPYRPDAEIERRAFTGRGDRGTPGRGVSSRVGSERRQRQEPSRTRAGEARGRPGTGDTYDDEVDARGARETRGDPARGRHDDTARRAPAQRTRGPGGPQSRPAHPPGRDDQKSCTGGAPAKTCQRLAANTARIGDEHVDPGGAQTGQPPRRERASGMGVDFDCPDGGRDGCRGALPGPDRRIGRGRRRQGDGAEESHERGEQRAARSGGGVPHDGPLYPQEWTGDAAS